MVAEPVSEPREFEIVSQAVELIDEGLGTMRAREIVSTSEVTDLLLDLRSLLTPLTAEELDETEVAVASS